MREKIGQIGGKITRDSFPCDYCTEWKGGGFSPIHGMQLCANKLYNKNHQEDVMAHGVSTIPLGRKAASLKRPQR